MVKVYSNDRNIVNFYSHKKSIRDLESKKERGELNEHGLKRLIAYKKYVETVYGIGL